MFRRRTFQRIGIGLVAILLAAGLWELATMSVSYASQLGDRAVWSMKDRAKGGGVDAKEHDLSDQRITCAKDCWDKQQLAAAKLRAFEGPFRDLPIVPEEEGVLSARATPPVEDIFNDFPRLVAPPILPGQTTRLVTAPGNGGPIGGNVFPPFLPSLPGGGGGGGGVPGSGPGSPTPPPAPPPGPGPGPNPGPGPGPGMPPIDVPAPPAFLLLGLAAAAFGIGRHLGGRRANR